MKAAPALCLVVAGAVGGCFSICQPKLESAVDAPVTVAAAKALDHPPDVVVTVGRVTHKEPMGAGCGHSPLCLIFLPVMLWDDMFPEKYDEVVVVDHSVETYRGAFAVNGDFLQARQTKDGVVRDLRQLKLDKLGKRVVVEVARGPTPEAMKPVPIVPQLDLVAAYRTALAKEGDAYRRGELDAEALAWLDAEAMPLVEERLKDAAVADEEKAVVIAGVCGQSSQSATSSSSSEATIRALVADAAQAPGPLTASSVLTACMLPLGGDAKLPFGADAQPFVAATVDAVCKRGRGMDAREWRRLIERGAEPFATMARTHATSTSTACKAPGAAAYVAFSLGDDVDDKTLTADAVIKGAFAKDLVGDPRVVKHAAFVGAAVDDDDLAPDMLENLLKAPPAPLDAALIAPLARRYAKGVHAMFCTGWEREAGVIALLAKQPASSRAAAAAVLTTSRAANAKRGAIVDAALVAVGADVDGDELRKLLARETKNTTTTCEDSSVARAAVDVAGCTPADLKKPRIKCTAPAPVKGK